MLSEVIYRLEVGKLFGGMFDFAFIHKLHHYREERTADFTSTLHLIFV